MWGIPLPGRTEVQWMPRVKENTRKIMVFAILIRINTLKHNWRSMNWWIIVSNSRVSEDKYCISSSLVVIIVHGRQPPRSWSTTIIRCQQDTGSAIIITISQHDTESAITIKISDTWSTIIIHDVAAATALDLRTIRQRDSGEEVKSVTCIDEILISLMW